MGHEGSELGRGAKENQRKRGGSGGEIVGLGDFSRDGAGLRLIGAGWELQFKAIDILARQGRVTRGAQNARCGDSQIPKGTKPGTRMEVPQPGTMKSGQE